MNRLFKITPRTKKVMLICAIVLIAAVLVFGYRGLVLGGKIAGTANTLTVESFPVRTFSASDLLQYDGTDPAKPIYLAYEGAVYDVTAGKEFYVPGGSYHYLAGRDSTTELHIAGGEIIKRKYPIVGRYAE